MAKTTELEAAYRATTYRVFLPGGGCDLRAGVASETLRCWLETAGVGEFAILTAHNPGAERGDEAGNGARQSQLECDLLAAGYEPYAGENVAADGGWPDEETCFVAGIPLAEAAALAVKYGQTAIIHGGSDGRPVIVWLETAAVDAATA
jgi:Protein of unknown function (DUF3293)